MIMKETVRNYKDLFNKAIKLERYQINDSNSAKNIRCYNAVIGCLEHLDGDTVLVVETAKGKGNRPFDLPNIGSLMETLVKAVCFKEKLETYEKEFSNDNADIKIGWCNYEIKASMGCVSRNTKIVGDKPLLFVNTCGVFSIRKDEISKYTKDGKLPYNKPVGREWVTLSAKLGLGN